MIKSALCSVLLVAAVSPAFAAPGDELELKDTKYRMVVDGHLVRRPETCGTTKEPGPIIADDPTWSNVLNEPQVVYINKNGATFTFTGTGTTSSATNTVRGGGSSGFPSSGQVTIAPQTVENWDQIMTCIRTSFSPFNITVVETEPSSGPYVEAILGGNDGSEIGFDFGLFGIAATSSFCNLYRTGIAFNFYGTHFAEFGGGTAKYLAPELCNTIVHEVGHVLGLEHEAWRADHMSYDYISDSGAACTANPFMCKSVVNGAHPCGTYQGQGQPCSCAGTPATTSSTVNSYAKLMDYIGPSNVVPDTVAPTLSIVSPTDFTSMPRDFDVTVQAQDDRGVSAVTLLVDGTQVDMATTPTTGSSYVLSVADATEGTHTLVARAVDAAGNMDDTTVEFTVVLAQTGDECTTNEECSGGICANSPSGRFCTEACTEGSCPTDFRCATIGNGEMICIPDPDDTDDGTTDDTTDGNNATDDGEGGGCCSTSTGSGALSGGLLALGVGLVLSRRRRR